LNKKNKKQIKKTFARQIGFQHLKRWKSLKKPLAGSKAIKKELFYFVLLFNDKSAHLSVFTAMLNNN